MHVVSGCAYIVGFATARKRFRPVYCGRLPALAEPGDDDDGEGRRQLCPEHYAIVATCDLREALQHRVNNQFDHATVAEARRLIAAWGLA